MVSIPTHLRAATALQRLRVADEGAGLRITPADLDTLSALRSLTFLSVTQVPPCNGCWTKHLAAAVAHTKPPGLSASSSVSYRTWHIWS
jgi:hypothetical protein